MLTSRVVLGALAAAVLSTAPVVAQSGLTSSGDRGSQGTTQVIWVPAGQLVTVTARSGDAEIDLEVQGRYGALLGEQRGCGDCVVQFASMTSQEVRIVTSGPAQIHVTCPGCVPRQPSGPVWGLPFGPGTR